MRLFGAGVGSNPLYTCRQILEVESMEEDLVAVRTSFLVVVVASSLHCTAGGVNTREAVFLGRSHEDQTISWAAQPNASGTEASAKAL